MQQRKHRNAEERDIICNEIMKGLTDLKIQEHPRVKPFLDHVQLFRSSTSAQQFDGVIEMPDLGVKIEYILPGRRIHRHGVKVSKIEQQQPRSSPPRASLPL
jgi:hypothetical protein